MFKNLSQTLPRSDNIYKQLWTESEILYNIFYTVTSNSCIKNSRMSFRIDIYQHQQQQRLDYLNHSMLSNNNYDEDTDTWILVWKIKSKINKPEPVTAHNDGSDPWAINVSTQVFKSNWLYRVVLCNWSFFQSGVRNVLKVYIALNFE